MGTPTKAVGVSPKALSTLKRPPTLGSALMTSKPAALTSLSSGEPGSVTKSIWSTGFSPALSNCFWKRARCEEVSIVDPDFELTTTTVCARSVPIACRA